MHYTHFVTVCYNCKPPYMVHGSADTACDPKFTESFPMMRLMYGNDCHLDIEVAQLKEVMSRLQDGLYWNLVDSARPWRTSYNPTFDGTRRGGKLDDLDLANTGANGRMLRALVTRRELSRDPNQVGWTHTGNDTGPNAHSHQA